MLYVSPAYEIICGKTCESLYKNPNQFLEAIHPEDIGRVIASLSSDQYKEDGLFNEEFRIIRPDYQWSAEEFSSGIYFYRISTEKVSLTKKLLLLK